MSFIVEDGVWDQLISLYPHLVDCTTSNCSQVNRSLREVLHEYKDLLRPPNRIAIKNKEMTHPVQQNQKILNGV